MHAGSLHWISFDEWPQTTSVQIELIEEDDGTDRQCNGRGNGRVTNLLEPAAAN